MLKTRPRNSLFLPLVQNTPAEFLSSTECCYHYWHFRHPHHHSSRLRRSLHCDLRLSCVLLQAEFAPLKTFSYVSELFSLNFEEYYRTMPFKTILEIFCMLGYIKRTNTLLNVCSCVSLKRYCAVEICDTLK